MMSSKTRRVPQTLLTTLGFLIACGSRWAPSCSKDAISHQGWLLCVLSANSQLSPSSLCIFLAHTPCPAMVHIGYFELCSCCCPPHLTLHFIALFFPFFCAETSSHCASTHFRGGMPAMMLRIHRITYIHHAGAVKYTGVITFHSSELLDFPTTLGGLPCFCCMFHFTLINLVHISYFVQKLRHQHPHCTADFSPAL